MATRMATTEPVDAVDQIRKKIGLRHDIEFVQSWLFRTALRAVLGTNTETTISGPPSWPPSEQEQILLRLLCHPDTEADEVLFSQVTNLLITALAGIPTINSRALILHDLEHLPNCALAARLSCSPTASKTRVCRGKQLVRAELARIAATVGVEVVDTGHLDNGGER